MRKRLSALFTGSALVLTTASMLATAVTARAVHGPRARVAPEALTIPLYRYQSKSGSGVYAAYPAYREQFEKASSVWEKFGVVGHVYPSKQPGTMPLLALRKPGAGVGATAYFYTTDIDEAIAKQNSGWEAVQNYKGVVGYVATSPQPGTVAVYRYRQPAGAGGYLYAFGEGERSALKQSPGVAFEKTAFHVWAKPVEVNKPTTSNFPSPGGGSSDFPSGGPGDAKPPAGVDLSMRQALYFNGASAMKVDSASKYAAPGRPMTLKKGEALNCSGDYCTFNLGVYVQRGSGEGTLSGFAEMGGEGLPSVGNSFTFAPGSRSRDFVLPVKLRAGENRVRVTLDPYKKTAETNESNNSFEVIIVVEP